VGEISLYFYALTVVPWKDCWTGGIEKIPRHKEDRDRSGKLIKTKKERMEEIKRRDVFSIGRDGSCATLPQENHSYGNLPYNIFY
jgi:hypothetical protein